MNITPILWFYCDTLLQPNLTSARCLTDADQTNPAEITKLGLFFEGTPDYARKTLTFGRKQNAVWAHLLPFIVERTQLERKCLERRQTSFPHRCPESGVDSFCPWAQVVSQLTSSNIGVDHYLHLYKTTKQTKHLPGSIGGLFHRFSVLISTEPTVFAFIHWSSSDL